MGGAPSSLLRCLASTSKPNSTAPEFKEVSDSVTFADLYAAAQDPNAPSLAEAEKLRIEAKLRAGDRVPRIEINSRASACWEPSREVRSNRSHRARPRTPKAVAPVPAVVRPKALDGGSLAAAFAPAPAPGPAPERVAPTGELDAAEVATARSNGEAPAPAPGPAPERVAPTGGSDATPAATARSGGDTARSGGVTARSGGGTARSGGGTARGGRTSSRSPSRKRGGESTGGDGAPAAPATPPSTQRTPRKSWPSASASSRRAYKAMLSVGASGGPPSPPGALSTFTPRALIEPTFARPPPPEPPAADYSRELPYGSRPFHVAKEDVVSSARALACEVWDEPVRLGSRQLADAFGIEWESYIEHESVGRKGAPAHDERRRSVRQAAPACAGGEAAARHARDKPASDPSEEREPKEKPFGDQTFRRTHIDYSRLVEATRGGRSRASAGGSNHKGRGGPRRAAGAAAS